MIKKHAVIGHKEFKLFEQNDYENVITQEPVIIDIKEIVENPTWRL